MTLLLWIWQLPQHLLALIILLINRKNTRVMETATGIKYYLVKYIMDCGISLGDYIIIDADFSVCIVDVHHEYGHSIQSHIFGPLYLLVIGLPSIINNIISRVKDKPFKWYYTRYPEKWADSLGGVKQVETPSGYWYRRFRHK